MLRDLRDLFRDGGFVRMAAAVALGFGLVDLAHSVVVSFVITPLQRPYHGGGDAIDLLGVSLPLTTTIGGRAVPYGEPLGWALTFLVLLLAVCGLAKLAWREHQECPHCFSMIPLAALVCPACTRDVPDT